MTRRGVSVTMERREKALLKASTNDLKSKQSQVLSPDNRIATTNLSDSDISPGAYAVHIVRSSQSMQVSQSSIDESLRSWDPTETEIETEMEAQSEPASPWNQSVDNRRLRETNTNTITATVKATSTATGQKLVPEKEKKRTCQKWHIILLSCLLIVAIGGSIAVVLVTKNNGTSKNTSEGNQSRTTEPNTTTIRQECNFTNNNNINPSPVLQCSCASKIIVASEATTLLYMDMRASRLLSRYDGPNFDCRNENMALWWTAMDPRAATSFASISNVSAAATAAPANSQVYQQRYGLALLHLSLQGWNTPIDSSLWLGEDQECNWQGISCDVSSRITAINFTSFELTGELPGSSFALLPALTSLIMTHNSLTGSIPLEIWTLTKLKVLDLSSNKFEGTIPDAIIYLSELTLLRLGENNFNFLLPDNLYSLTKLERLSLSNNDFTGFLSLNIGILSKLQSISIGGNRFGFLLPSTLGDLTVLSTLSIERNGFTGTLPTELGLLSNHLNTISAFSNFFTGTLPTTLGALTELTTLDMGNNYFTGTLPVEFENWTKLEGLSLATNSLVGTLPSLHVSHLTTLHLEGNSFSGTAPDEFCTIANVSLPCTVECNCCIASCIP